MNHLPRVIRAGALAVALFAVSACEKVSDNAIEPVQLVDVLKASKEAGDSYLILDARDANAFKAGHIPGARRMVAADIDALDPDPKLKSYKAIYVYGEHPNHNAAKALVKRLLVAKTSDAYLMEEGFMGWKSQGHPVETKP